LSAFHAHGVKYLVVGGVAVIFHAQPRFTKDLDLFIKADPANAKATYAALAQFGAALEGLTPEDFTDRSSFFRFGREPKGFDILPNIPGVDFDAAWKRRVESVIDPTSGLKAFFISAEDLIASKLAAGRPQDIADADAVQKAQDLRPQKKSPRVETKTNDGGPKQ
jgi:hypothetical protein